jgi:hypothetical protein
VRSVLMTNELMNNHDLCGGLLLYRQKRLRSASPTPPDQTTVLRYGAPSGPWLGQSQKSRAPDDKGRAALLFAIDSSDRECPNFQFEFAAICTVTVVPRISHPAKNERDRPNCLYATLDTTT